MIPMPWFWWLGVLVLVLLAIVIVFNIIIIMRSLKAENANGIQFYKCCEHCGINFPEAGQSMCWLAKDKHGTPCNEPGFCTGKELVSN